MIGSKLLNKNQTELRKILENAASYPNAIQCFLDHHAILHSKKASGSDLPSYVDEILDDITEDQFRRILEKNEHSVAWCIWHIARISHRRGRLLVQAQYHRDAADAGQQAYSDPP